jgi:hypothetical protein
MAAASHGEHFQANTHTSYKGVRLVRLCAGLQSANGFEDCLAENQEAATNKRD